MIQFLSTAIVLGLTLTFVNPTAAADAKPTRDQAIAALKASDVQVDEAKSRVFFGCHYCQAPQLRQLAAVTDVRELNIRFETDVKETDAQALAALVHLDSILIHHCEMKDAFLAPVGTLTQLTTLSMISAPITDAGLKHLTNLTALEHLRVEGKGITDQGISHLAKLTKLKTLRLEGTSITEKGLATLHAALPKTEITTK